MTIEIKIILSILMLIIPLGLSYLGCYIGLQFAIGNFKIKRHPGLSICIGYTMCIISILGSIIAYVGLHELLL